jgi:hypothetical protein
MRDHDGGSDVFLITLALAHAAVVSGEVVSADGDDALGNGVLVDAVGAPFATEAGAVLHQLGIGSDDCIFLDQTPIFCNSDDPASVLTGFEASFGGTDAGQFVYSPSVGGSDAVYGHNGLLAVEDVQAPGGFGAGVTSTFHSRPKMRASGVAYWVSGVNRTGGTSTEERVFFRAPDADPSAISTVFVGGDSLAGGTLGLSNGIDFDFDVSNDDTHLINVLLLDTGSTADDGIVYVDGVEIAREGSLNGSGDSWDNFDVVVINNQGDFLFSGDTDGSTDTDEFIAYNGDIVLREGDTVDGVALSTTATVRFLSLNDEGAAAYGWDTSTEEFVFYACDASDLGNATRVLATGDELDIDGDGIGDAFVTDLNQSSGTPSNSLAGDGSLYVEVDLDFGAGDVEAIVRLDDPCCTDADGDGICDPELNVTPMVRGQSATLTVTVTGAQPGASVFFLASRFGVQTDALCHPSINVCADLLNPVFFPPAVASSSGTASVTVNVPLSLPSGVDVDFQAVWLDPAAGLGQGTQVERRTLQ